MQDRSKADTKAVIPFLKWAGGKRWLVATQESLFPATYQRYIEPFLGSGAVYFYLGPKRAILGDLNAELIETYQAIRDDWRSVVRLLGKHHRSHSKSYYYRVRDQRYRSAVGRAAQFIYLNRTCWNGLYRVNLNGKFNVPIGTKNDVLLDTDNFKTISEQLRLAKLIHSDFEPIINKAERDDLVFVDPPYTVKHNFNNFVKYNEKLFSWDDQVRLKDCLVRAKERGARVIVANAFHESIKKLYRGFGEFITLTRSSIIAASASHRKECEELIIRV